MDTKKENIKIEEKARELRNQFIDYVDWGNGGTIYLSLRKRNKVRY